MGQFNKGKSSLLAGQARPRRADIDPTATLAFCFKHFDGVQGQKFEEWEAEKLLSKMLNRFKDYSGTHFLQCFNHRFKQYKGFPPHSKFKHPPHVPEDADWYVMHIEGKPCVAGHMLKNIFYIVFLDKDHLFYPIDLQARGK